jgi:hypothetical protein
MATGTPQDVNAGTQNQFVAKGDAQTTNPNVGAAGAQGEDKADASVLGARGTDTHVSGDIGQRILEPGHAWPERPFAGSYKGRLETRLEDEADNFLRKQATEDEKMTLEAKEKRYNQHGNVGFAGNYPVGWEVER